MERLKGRNNEAEELLRHALTALDFVEDEDVRETMTPVVNGVLAEVLLDTDRYEEAEPLIRRLRELAKAASDSPLEVIPETFDLGVVGMCDWTMVWHRAPRTVLLVGTTGPT